MGALLQESSDDRYQAFLAEFVGARKSIYAFIYVLMRNAADTDDVFQETSTILWNKFDQFERGSNFTAWAKQVARNLVMDFRKKRSRRPVVELDDATVDLLAFRYQRVQDHVEDRFEALKLCMGTLEAADRELVEKVYEQSKPVKKLAKKARVSVQSIYKRLGGIQGLLLRCVRRRMQATGGSL